MSSFKSGLLGTSVLIGMIVVVADEEGFESQDALTAQDSY
jgi:hypothetical protein